jgi:GTP-binding protein SAR1
MMSIWETLSSWWDILWQSLGLKGKEGSVVLLGLDNAGKTTLLHRLRTGKIQQHTFPPTDRPSAAANTFQYQGVTLAAWDLGGHEVVRHLWADYVASERARSKQKVAILFLIDAADLERVEEAGYELDNLIHESLLKEGGEEEGVSGHYLYTGNGARAYSNAASTASSLLPPVAIFLNKCDLATAASTDEICQRMDWTSVEAVYPLDKIRIFRGSVWKEDGYPDVFRWIATFF